jgi:hypothetical protein
VREYHPACGLGPQRRRRVHLRVRRRGLGPIGEYAVQSRGPAPVRGPLLCFRFRQKSSGGGANLRRAAAGGMVRAGRTPRRPEGSRSKLPRSGCPGPLFQHPRMAPRPPEDAAHGRGAESVRGVATINRNSGVTEWEAETVTRKCCSTWERGASTSRGAKPSRSALNCNPYSVANRSKGSVTGSSLTGWGNVSAVSVGARPVRRKAPLP